MSGYDVAVWHSTVAMTPTQASSFYRHITSDAVMFAHDPQTDSFVADLRRVYPDRSAGEKLPSCTDTPVYYLQSRDDAAPKPEPLTPEAMARMKAEAETVWNGDIDCFGPAATMSIAWSQAPKVFPIIQALAAKHGLTFYETEGGTVVVPPGLALGNSPPLARLRVTLRITGKQPSLETTILFDQSQVAGVTFVNRQRAHDLARRIATEKGDFGYKVDDPGSMAQAFTLVPVQTSPNNPNVGIYRVMPRDELPDGASHKPDAPMSDQPP